MHFLVIVIILQRWEHVPSQPTSLDLSVVHVVKVLADPQTQPASSFPPVCICQPIHNLHLGFMVIVMMKIHDDGVPKPISLLCQLVALVALQETLPFPFSPGSISQLAPDMRFSLHRPALFPSSRSHAITKHHSPRPCQSYLP